MALYAYETNALHINSYYASSTCNGTSNPCAALALLSNASSIIIIPPAPSSVHAIVGANMNIPPHARPKECWPAWRRLYRSCQATCHTSRKELGFHPTHLAQKNSFNYMTNLPPLKRSGAAPITPFGLNAEDGVMTPSEEDMEDKDDKELRPE